MLRRGGLGLGIGAAATLVCLLSVTSAAPVDKSGFGNCAKMFLNGVPPDSMYTETNAGDIYLKLCKTYGDGTPLFAVLFNKELRIPEWVAYSMTYRQSADLDRNDCSWQRDDEIKELETNKVVFQARDSDYTNSGYQRGHLLPASTCAWSAESLCATFQFSNAVPQIGSFNSKLWAYTEYTVRNYMHSLWQVGDTDPVYVVTGIHITKAKPKVISKHKIAVPDSMYTVMWHPEKNVGFAVSGANKKDQPKTLMNNDFLKLKSVAELETELGREVLGERVSGCLFCSGFVDKEFDGRSLGHYQTKSDPYSVGDMNECKEFCDNILEFWCDGKKAKEYCSTVGSFFSERRARCRQYAMVMHRGDVADEILKNTDKGNYNFKPEWKKVCRNAKNKWNKKDANSLCSSNGFCALALFRSPAKIKGADVKEGYLYKKSWKTFAFSISSKRRYFVLDSSRVAVYLNEDNYKNAPESPRAEIKLRDVKDLEELETNKRPCFRVVTVSNKFDICADNKIERDAWVKAIRSHEKQFFPTGLPIKLEELDEI